MNLLDKSIRTQFALFFPNPETIKKRRSSGKASVQKEEENPYKAITHWFDSGNSVEDLLHVTDKNKLLQLYRVDGLHALVKRYYPQANDLENALLMEFVLHGLAAHSLISKNIIDNRIEFKDLMGSMVNLGSASFSGEEFDDEH